MGFSIEPGHSLFGRGLFCPKCGSLSAAQMVYEVDTGLWQCERCHFTWEIFVIEVGGVDVCDRDARAALRCDESVWQE